MAKERGRPFEPGNKFGRGRPRGSRNKEKPQAEALLEQYESNIVGKCIAMALEGKASAMNLCMDRVLPMGHRRVKFPFKKTRTIPEINQAFEQLAQALRKGKLAPTEAESVSRMLEAKSRILEKTDMAIRIEQLEKRAREEQSEPRGENDGPSSLLSPTEKR